LLGIILLLIVNQPQEGKTAASKEDLRREYVTKGMTAYTEEDYRNAIGFFKGAFEIDTTYAALSYNIACCYSLLNLKDSAIIWVKRTVELGTYEFEEDKDFDNIRDMKEFKRIALRSKELLKEAKKRKWESLIFIPPDYDSSQKYPLFIVLHGYGSSPSDFTRELPIFLTEKGFIFLIPYGTEVHGLTSFSWGDVDKCEEKILKDIEEVKSKYSIDTTRIILLGYSQGGSRTFSLGVRNPEVFKAIITVAGTFNEEEVKDYLNKLKGKDFRLYMMIGGKDRKERIKSNEMAKRLLKQYGAKVHLEIYPEVGHAFPGDPLKEVGKALKFIMGE